MTEIPTLRDWHDSVEDDAFNLADLIPPGEGLMAAFIPDVLEEADMVEHLYRDGDRQFALFVHAGVALDMLPADGGPCKWWMVREAARAVRADEIQPIWSGLAEEFSLINLPDVPQPPETQLAVRQYSRGPWIRIPYKEKV